MVWLSNYFFALRDLIFLKNKSWFRFGLAILPALPICLSITCKSQLWKKQKGDPSKDYHLLFYQRPIPAVVACAGIHELPFQIRTRFDFPKKQDMIWLRNYFPRCTICLSKNSLSKPIGNLILKKQTMIWLSNFFPNCVISLSKKTSHGLDLS
jgi:hypothetical protein